MKLKNSLASAVVNSGFSVGTTYANERIKQNFWEKKNKPTLDDELEDIDNAIFNLRREVNKLKARKKAEIQSHLVPDSPDEGSLYDSLNSEGIPFVPLLKNWIVEGQNAIIFSQSDQGKTSLCMQIALGFALGQSSLIFNADDYSYSPCKVIYYNGELDNGDLKHRFPDSSLFKGIDFTLVNGNPFGTIERFVADVETRMAGLGKRCIVFIDNITKYFPTFQSENARQFYNRMERLQTQVKEQNPNASLTFVLVGHTTKTGSVPMTQELLAGSSNLTNFAKSIIALGATKNSMVKYVKLVKAKHCPTGDPVMVVRKVSKPFWRFEFIDEMKEVEAMEYDGKDIPTEPKPQQKPGPESTRHPELSPEQIQELKVMVDAYEAHKTDATVPYVVVNGIEMSTKKAMAEYFGIPDSYVARYLKKL